MHEDFDVCLPTFFPCFCFYFVKKKLEFFLQLFGRGFNQVVMTKDLNMLEWMNGNCYRTSHYPYSEERAYEADRRGIVVIAETPAVGLLFVA